MAILPAFVNAYKNGLDRINSSKRVTEVLCRPACIFTLKYILYT